MSIEVKEIHGKEFLKIDVLAVRQKGKNFYLAIVPARAILETYTAVPAEYNVNKEVVFAATFPDDAQYFDYRLDIDRKRLESTDFERKLDKSRITQIRDFLNDNEHALFPNTIIVTCELINDSISIPPGTRIEDIEDLADERFAGLSFLEESEEPVNETILYVPRKKGSILVIDGQHRLRGLEEAQEEVIDNYELLVTFVLGFSRSVIAELFYTINYTQKAVSKSLLYHLMGEFGRELDEITFMHETVRILNEVSPSPFYKRIKMLGTVEPGVSREEREKMTISQAFLIDYLVGTISAEAKRSIYPPIFLYYYKRDKLRIEIVRFLIKYFVAIRESLSQDWDDPRESIICNSLGVGALIRVLYFMFVKMFVTEYDSDPTRMTELKVDDFAYRLRGIENVDFSKRGEYGRLGSVGGLNKLKEDLVDNISYFEATTYDEFLKEYRDTYLEPYKEWLSTVK